MPTRERDLQRPRQREREVESGLGEEAVDETGPVQVLAPAHLTLWLRETVNASTAPGAERAGPSAESERGLFFVSRRTRQPRGEGSTQTRYNLPAVP